MLVSFDPIGGSTQLIKVDAHQHFWDPATAHYPWMSDQVAPLVRRFGPEDLQPLLKENDIHQSIVVQARSELSETRELLAMADANDFLAGVVGWVDLTDPRLDEVLGKLLDGPHGRWLVGVRHQVEDEPDPRWLLRPEVQRGLEAVQDRGLVYDLLVRPRDLPAAVEVVGRLPETRFVVDHIAKPKIESGDIEPWAKHLRDLSQHPNTWCKLSGIVNEAGKRWKLDQLVPYVERVVDIFGTDRLLYGSDWPVVTLFASYKEQLDALMHVLSSISDQERSKIMGGNAIEVYDLESGEKRDKE